MRTAASLKQAPSQSQFTQNPKDIFLTGATGFVGAWLLWEFLQHSKARVHCLVRAANVEQARGRLHKILKYYLPDEDLSAHAERIIPILGDLSRPQLGLDDAQFASLAQTIDFICHCGGNVASGNQGALDAANESGTRSMIALAKQGPVKPFHFISTVAVSGNRLPQVTERFRETDLELGQSFLGYRADYAQSKYQAELLVRELGAEGHPVRTYRLGQVVGDSRCGRFKREIFTDNFYRYLKMMIDFEIFLAVHRDRERSINIIPVDIAARQVVHIALKPEIQGDTFHPAPAA